MRDRLVSLLNDYGYQPVFLPMSGLEPPEVYNHDGGKLIRRGPLRHYLGTTRLPSTQAGVLPDLEAHHTSRKGMSQATQFLRNALACIGVGSAKLALSFVGSDDIVFSFSDVTTHRLDPSALDPIFKSLDVHAIPKEYVTEKLHVAYEYIYARRVSLRREDGKRFASDITGNVAEHIDVGAKGRVNVENDTTITFSAGNDAPAAIGYKAGQLRLADGIWAFYPEVIARSRDGEEDRLPYLPKRNVVLSALD